MILIQLFSSNSIEKLHKNTISEGKESLTSLKCSQKMIEEMNSTNERIVSDNIKSEYLKTTSKVFESLINPKEKYRYKFDSLCMLLNYTKKYLHDKYHYEYQPIYSPETRKIIQMLDPIDLMKEGLQWIENEKISQIIASSQFKELMKFIEKDEIQFDIQKEIEMYLSLLVSISMHFSENENVEKYEGCVRKFQLFMSLNLLFIICPFKDRSTDESAPVNIYASFFSSLSRIALIKPMELTA